MFVKKCSRPGLPTVKIFAACAGDSFIGGSMDNMDCMDCMDCMDKTCRLICCLGLIGINEQQGSLVAALFCFCLLYNLH